MARLRTVKPKLSAAPAKLITATTRDSRMTGRKLQDRRLRIWTADSKCAGCGRFTLFPHGFELDHRVPLFLGGADTDANCQILCVDYDDAGNKVGCHAAKSAVEAKG